MATIGLDATYLSVYGKGMARYQYNLIKGLSKLDKKNCYYVFLNRKNILPELPRQDNFHYIKKKKKKNKIWYQSHLHKKKKKKNFYIYLFFLDTLPVFSKTKFVLFL